MIGSFAIAFRMKIENTLFGRIRVPKAVPSRSATTSSRFSRAYESASRSPASFVMLYGWSGSRGCFSSSGWYRGSHAGTLGDAGAFSFHPRKSITTGEGGMLTTERADLDALFRSLRDHGATRSDHERQGM